MKAYVLEGIGELVYKDVPIPRLHEDEALVEVVNAGICGSDIPRIFETGTYHFPTIPGHEFAGVVRDVGGKEHADWLGKRVGVFPLIPCMQCEQCKKKNYEMCQAYNYLGSRTDGGFAEYAAVPVWNLIPAGNEPSGCLQTFGDCRVGHIPRSSAALQVGCPSACCGVVD